MVIELDGTLYQITYFQHVKPGKGGAFVRTKIKYVLTGGVVDKTFRAGEKVTEVRLVRRPIQYSLHGRKPVLLHGHGDVRDDPPLRGHRRRGPAAVPRREHGVRGADT